MCWNSKFQHDHKSIVKTQKLYSKFKHKSYFEFEFESNDKRERKIQITNQRVAHKISKLIVLIRYFNIAY